MTWGLQQREFPILTPGQMNPWNQALSSGLDTYSNMTKAAYQPEMLQSQINSKNAYAEYGPMSYLAKMMQDPRFAASLTPDQIKGIATKLTQGSGSLQSEKPGFLTQMWDKVTGQETGGNVPRRTNEGTQGSTGSGIMMSPPASTSLKNDPYSGGVGQAIADQVGSNHSYLKPVTNPNMVGNVDLTNPTSNKFGTDTGTPEGNRQLAIREPAPHLDLELKKQNLAMQNQGNLWTKRIEENGKQVDTTNKSLETLQAMKALRPQLGWYEKGFGFGSVKPIFSTAQMMDQLAKTQSTTNLRALQTGHITNTDFAIGEKLKPGRDLNDKAFNTMIDYNEALNIRAKERQQFDAVAESNGMPLGEADALWGKFIEKYPIFNIESETLNKKNIGRSPFEMMQKPKRLPIADKEGRNSSQLEGQSPPTGSIWMITPEGDQVDVHKSRVDEAIKESGYKAVG